jgi:hypothetical protein
LRYIKQLLQVIRESLADGWNSTSGRPEEDEQEQERRRIAEHADNAKWTDQQVHMEYLKYVSKYDRRVRLTRTHQLRDIIMEKRPALRRESP